MNTTRASITTLLIGTAVLFLGYGLLVTLLPLRARIEDFSTTMIGVMGGAYFAGFAVGCLIGPQVVKRVGHIRAFAGFAAMATVLLLVLPMAIDPGVWAGMRGLTGICFAVLFLVIESWLNDQSSNEIRGRVLSIYIIVTNLVTMGGQLMVNLAEPAGPVLFTVAAILICLSLVPLSLTPTATPKPIAEAKLRIGQLYKYSPSGFVGCLAFGLADGAFWSLAPVFADGRGMAVADITYVMSLFVVGGSISQWPLGHYSDKVDRRWVIAICCAGSLCTGASLAFFDLDQRWLAYALACAHGAFMLPIYRRAVYRRAVDANFRSRQPVLLHFHDPRPAAGLCPVPSQPPAGRPAGGAGRVLPGAQDLAVGLLSGNRRLSLCTAITGGGPCCSW